MRDSTESCPRQRVDGERRDNELARRIQETTKNTPNAEGIQTGRPEGLPNAGGPHDLRYARKGGRLLEDPYRNESDLQPGR